LRATVVAGVGGLIIGHIIWLIAISTAIATSDVDRSVLIAIAVIAVLSVAAIVVGWRFHRRRSEIWTAFLWCLPISPVLFSLSVLGVTYL
jgi:membrane protein implicated in regulation of membrane protease activity